MSSGVKSGFDVYWFSTSVSSNRVPFPLDERSGDPNEKAAMMMMRGMTAKDFDPVRYAGRWFEVASLKRGFAGQDYLLKADVESPGILLDVSVRAKLANLGYLVTDKCDFYSIGVDVGIVNWLMVKCGLDLVNIFVFEVEKNGIKEVLDINVVNEGNADKIRQFALLGVKCGEKIGEQRPTTINIVEELRLLVQRE
ncbi:hypothetical protein KSS87_010950 [Heliosperma pusillum]|nr:hypothetical protein KSS87_010950 [Heliosperma pusillum]